MKELLILALIAAVGYLAYDDYYKQRPALQQAQQQIQELTAGANQVRQNPVGVGAAPSQRVWAPVAPTPPAWFQKRLEQSSSLEGPRQHIHERERAPTPQP